MALKKVSNKFFHEEYLINSFPVDDSQAGIFVQGYFSSCFKPGFRASTENAEFAVYALILDGSYTVIKENGQTENFAAGDFNIVFPPEANGEKYRLAVTGKKSLLRKVISVRRNAFHDWLISKMFYGSGRKICLRKPERIEAIMDEMRNAMSDNTAYNLPKQGGIFFQLLQELQLQYHEKRLPDGIRQAVNYIGQNYSRSALSRSEIAESAAVSVRTLSRLFKEHFGTGVTEYVIAFRLEQTYALLRYSNLRINEIASRCGFRNAGFMTRQFREKYQITPREYRKLTKSQ